MKLRFTAKADKDYARLPKAVRKAFGKQLRFLLTNLQHPSLHAKKYSESMDVWQGRVTKGWRFYFKVEGEEYVILSIIPHPK
ncbi:MAG: type II toxin-antitoxin system RelE/ParE family toxin [Candidatus Korobacteraceae bacterium]|jgi:mRNA-degrading endonuclease RelE of RelBE toxin-antitoxin system